MAQTSTTLLSSKSHKADITVTEGATFTVTGSEYKISTTSTSLSNLAQFDVISVTGTTNNNSTFTVKSVVSTTEFTVEEIVTTEASDGSTTVTLDHTGFVTDKAKGDGYFSQIDGVHTVVYQVVNLGDSTDDFTGNVKMQGSLATPPTEVDFFDIDNTTMTSDQSTKIASFNFTGNFVWVRAKVTTTNGSSNPSMITSILLNN